nr:hypothetical protein CFP56_07051 [Quercus suber]
MSFDSRIDVSKRPPGLSCNVSLICAVDPGVVETNIMREVPSCLSCVAFTVLKFLGLLQSPKKGISSVLDAALAQPDISGVYLFNGKGFRDIKIRILHRIVGGRECLHQRKAKRNSMDLKWWQLHGVRLMACSLLSLSVLLHHGCCDRCSLAVAEL